MEKKHGLPGQPESISCYPLPDAVPIWMASFPFTLAVWAQMTTVTGPVGLYPQLNTGKTHSCSIAFFHLLVFWKTTRCWSWLYETQRERAALFSLGLSPRFLLSVRMLRPSSAGSVSDFSSGSDRFIQSIQSTFTEQDCSLCPGLFWKPQW